MVRLRLVAERQLSSRAARSLNPLLTIVIPVLNEARILPARLEDLQFVRCRDVELIVVDGGSTDDSFEISRALSDHVLSAPAGRAKQMNEGARHASSEWLLFLHADTRLEGEAFEALLEALVREPDWGWFDVRIEGKHPLLSLTAAMMNSRAGLTKVATGDQGLFIRKALFDTVGGFPDIRLMEDVALSKALRGVAKSTVVRTPLATDGRRWDQGGWFRTVLKMWGLRFAYWAGVGPDRLADYYAHVRGR